MHYIQKHILDSLRNTQSVRYAKLNPDNIESGHFRYHMKQLVQDGYVEQIERGLYGLTGQGQKLVDKLSANKINPAAMPKIITYTLLKNDSNIILQKKPKQPYIDLLNMIGGKVHEGETTTQASIREVKEKTNLDIKDPLLGGIFEILISKDDQLFTHAIAYVYLANISNSDMPTDKNLEVISESKIRSTKNLAPDFLPIFDNIKDLAIVQTCTLKIKV